MTSAHRPDWLTDEMELLAQPLPRIDLQLGRCIWHGDWLAGEPSAFDTEHNETARFYATNSGLSPIILGDFDPDLPGESIPRGYTELFLYEKRAVIVDGALARLWRERYPLAKRMEPHGFTGFTEGRRDKHLSLGLDGSITHAVNQAETLSARMNGAPVLVARLLQQTGWH